MTEDVLRAAWGDVETRARRIAAMKAAAQARNPLYS